MFLICNNNGQPYIVINDLWQALHCTFNSTQNQQINMNILEEIPLKSLSTQPLFSNNEFTNTINKCKNLSTPIPNRILWKYLKAVVKNTEYLNNIVNIGNIHVLCINPVYWLLHFKLSSLVIIPKPKKAFYDSSKIFCSIILLNML